MAAVFRESSCIRKPLSTLAPAATIRDSHGMATRGEDMALDHARDLVERLIEDRAKLARFSSAID